MDQTRQSAPLEVKFDAGTAHTGRVRGYASVWGGPPDAYGDIIAMGAFAKTIAEHQAQGTMPVMLWSHDTHRPIGKWTSLQEDDYGLRVEGMFNLATTAGREASEHVKAGDVTGFSIGYAVAPEGRTPGPTRGSSILTEIHLAEISVVALPANRRARVTLDSKRDLEELLHKSGIARAAAVKLANGGWAALQDGDPEEQSQRVKQAAARIEALAEQMRTGR